MQSRGILSSNAHISSAASSGYTPYTRSTLDHGSTSAHGAHGIHVPHASSVLTNGHVSSQNPTPTLISSSLPSGIDMSSYHGYSGVGGGQATPAPSLGGSIGGHGGADRTPGSGSTSANNEQTLKSLQKHYMNAITSLNPQLPHNGTPEKSQPTEDPDAKKPTELIDDILKLWEESQSENRRLRLENNALKLELQTTKTQLELAVQASTQNSESDNQKEEKLVMEKKIADLEDKLRQFNISTLTTDQTISQLKDETSRLKEENAGLIKAISKLSN